MNEQLRLRIDGGLAREAAEVCRELGITPTSAVSMLFTQMVKLRALPFRPSNFPALDEYGVTYEEATKAEDEAIEEIKKSRDAGRLHQFTGKL